ncbi:MAG: PD-(D/E)XK nuclease-like domain-containing protein, partial [Myxococcota bacterium]|nr:PD-(D/E)XK nuclease-like domain-containing protein [Myxococcota bacterium]
FGKQVEDLRYYRQAAFYIRCAAILGLPERDFAFIAVEKEPPFLTWVHEVPAKWLVAAEVELDLLLERYAECERTGVWPGYPGGLRELQPTDWQMRALEHRVEALQRLEVAAR